MIANEILLAATAALSIAEPLAGIHKALKETLSSISE